MPGFDINWKISETSGIARVKFIELQLLLHHQLLGAWQRWLFFSDRDVPAADWPYFLKLLQDMVTKIFKNIFPIWKFQWNSGSFLTRE